MPVALTIAGLDPSGGAGIIADIRTFAAFGCYPTAAVTSITFQNSGKLFGAVHQKPKDVRAQVLAVAQEHRIAALKLGMLPTPEIISEIAELVRSGSLVTGNRLGLPAPVLDPVMRSSSGYELTTAGSIKVMAGELFRLARLVTPNIAEAECLAGIHISDEATMREGAAQLRGMGAPAVLIKGGHLIGEPMDVLDDGGDVTVFRGRRIHSAMRGTGCCLSAAIAACLACGLGLKEAVESAREFTARAIENAGVY